MDYKKNNYKLYIKYSIIAISVDIYTNLDDIYVTKILQATNKITQVSECDYCTGIDS